MSVEVRNISKSFGDFVALRDVSLRVPTGSLVALLGPSGSGKTTLLRIIAGLEQPDDGSGPILFNEEDVAQSRTEGRRVGFVFQHYALFRHMSVYENIAFGLRVRPRRIRPDRHAIDGKVRGLLQLVQLESLAGRYPHQLSGGQRQRVALARALAVEPRVLLLDEPFGALDARVRQELRRWLRRLHDEMHVTSVFVTHDQDEALDVADTIVVMNRGHVEQAGTPDEVFHEPRTEFVMNFLGQVNRFPGRIERGVLSFASLAIEPPAGSAGSGRSARVFVRPHDLIVDTHAIGRESFRATVMRVHSAGPIVRLELSTPGGETVLADVPQNRFRALGVSNGDTVFVAPNGVHVFPDSPG